MSGSERPPLRTFVSSMSSSVVMSVASPPSPGASPSHSSASSSAQGLDALVQFQRLPQGRMRNLFLRDVLAQCTRNELLLVSTLVAPRLKRDFLGELPTEIALHVLSYMDDAPTLARVSCVSRAWCRLLRDEHLWKRVSRVYEYNVDSGMFREDVPYRRRFKTAFLTERNWRSGGRLIRANRTPNEGTVTSIAMDSEWIVVGYENKNINVYHTKTGYKHATLFGHSQGVWALCLISAGGRLLQPHEYALPKPAPSTTPPGSPPKSSAMSYGIGPASILHAEPIPVSVKLTSSRPAPRPELRSDPCNATRGYGQPGAIVVSGSSDRSVRVWDIRTGKCLFAMMGHTATLRCMKALQQRPIVVTGSRDGTLRVWDIERGESVRTMSGHGDSVRCLDVYANQVVSASYDTTLRLWDVDTGECLRTFLGHTSPVYAVGYDGLRIASGGIDTFARIWSAERGYCIALLQGHSTLICKLELTSNLVCTGSADGRVLVFDIARGYELQHRLTPHTLSTLSALQTTTRDAGCLVNHLMVSAASGGPIVLTDLRSGQEICELSSKCDSIWAVGVRDDTLVLVGTRHSQTVVEVWSYRPPPDETDG